LFFKTDIKNTGKSYILSVCSYFQFILKHPDS
jgi:hypothetical protein